MRSRPGFLAALVIAASVALLTLAVTLALASLPTSELTAGTAGPGLARMLALAAGAAGMFGLAAGILLAGSRRSLAGLTPAVAVGMIIGGLQAMLLLIPVTSILILAPWAILPLALPIVANVLGFGR